MKNCSKDYEIRQVNSTSVLQYQHQCELEQKKIDDAGAPKVDKNNWAKTIENIVLNLKLVRCIRGALPAYVVRCHVKVAHISPGYGAYLNLEKEMIARAPIIDAKSSLKMTQETLDKAYLNYQVDAFKIDNAMVCEILSKVFTNMDAYVFMKQRWMIKQCTSMFTSISLALTTWPGRLQKQKKAKLPLWRKMWD